MAAKLDDNLDDDKEIELQTKELTQVGVSWIYYPFSLVIYPLSSPTFPTHCVEAKDPNWESCSARKFNDQRHFLSR